MSKKMSDKSDKYYDEVNLYPNVEYKGNKQTTKIFGIRLTQEEIDTWKAMKLSKTIHKILAGEDKSNDSIRINTLKHNLRWLYNFMSEKCEITGEVDPGVIEKLQQIKEVM